MLNKVIFSKVLGAGLEQASGFNFSAIASAVGVISIGLTAIALIGSAIWPQWASKNKETIQNVIIGFVLLGISSFLMSALGG